MHRKPTQQSHASKKKKHKIMCSNFVQQSLCLSICELDGDGWANLSLNLIKLIEYAYSTPQTMTVLAHGKIALKMIEKNCENVAFACFFC